MHGQIHPHLIIMKKETAWRHLSSREQEELEHLNNIADAWRDVFVGEGFSPCNVRGSRFCGRVYIGGFSAKKTELQGFSLPVGIYNSFIDSCTIGENCAIHEVKYLSHYDIGDRCIVFNIGELYSTTEKKGLFPVDVMNENGGRRIYPFEDMTTADAYLWAKYADDKALQSALKGFSEAASDQEGNFSIGDNCLITTSGTIKNSTIKSACSIRGAGKIDNVIVKSSSDEPTNIGCNVILKDGVVGLGCNISSGSTAIRFVLGSNCTLSLGARLIDTCLGDNSTISCCEVRNSLIFPSHEQHHNNSFLIAARIGGQSNIAAGATIGSNHNSRTPDGELVAGRGFWPGLCTSVKHSSVFASYTLLAKGSYPAELNIPLPFSLVSNNPHTNELEIIPAFWWLYNMYALERNRSKFGKRDKRKTKVQHIEFDPFAPDSMEEVLHARKFLESKVKKEILSSQEGDECEIFAEGMENSRRKVRILKAGKAYRAYGDMLVHYAVSAMEQYLSSCNKGSILSVLQKAGSGPLGWENIGGQLITKGDVLKLREDVNSGRLSSWKDIHTRYDELWDKYPFEKALHACSILCEAAGKNHLTEEDWGRVLKEDERIREYIKEAAFQSRQKDYKNPFRRATYRNEEEMLAVTGPMEENTKK